MKQSRKKWFVAAICIIIVLAKRTDCHEEQRGCEAERNY